MKTPGATVGAYKPNLMARRLLEGHGRHAMAGHDSYAFTYGGVHKAPDVSGLFTIYSPQRRVYAGESDDIRQSLYQLLNDSPAWMDRSGPLSFSFERLTRADRAARQ